MKGKRASGHLLFPLSRLHRLPFHGFRV